MKQILFVAVLVSCLYVGTPVIAFSCDANDTQQSSIQVKFSRERLRGRVYGFSWVLLEKRDPNFDGNKLKEESQVMWVLKAMEFATKEEIDVINKLVDISEDRVASGDQNDYIIGALEGKVIEYSHLSPQLLLEDKEIRSKK